jgi:hypothetical protein
MIAVYFVRNGLKIRVDVKEGSVNISETLRGPGEGSKPWKFSVKLTHGPTGVGVGVGVTQVGQFEDTRVI